MAVKVKKLEIGDLVEINERRYDVQELFGDLRSHGEG